MRLIDGIHHYSMKCTPAQLEGVRTFYSGVLGLPVVRETTTALLFDTGAGLIEVFFNGEGDPNRGAIRHIALATQSVDACAEAVRAAGYEVFMAPKDITTPVNARIAFCIGPLGEQLEFMQAK